MGISSLERAGNWGWVGDSCPGPDVCPVFWRPFPGRGWSQSWGAGQGWIHWKIPGIGVRILTKNPKDWHQDPEWIPLENPWDLGLDPLWIPQENSRNWGQDLFWILLENPRDWSQDSDKNFQGLVSGS